MNPEPQHAYSASIRQAPATAAFTDNAMFLTRAPSDGTYEVAAWWPNLQGQNAETGSAA